MTRLRKISSTSPDPQIILDASEVLRSGGLVVFPTETVYGLGAAATDSTAVEKVFKAKGRPPDNPLIVHVGDINQLRVMSKNLTPNAMKLAEAFWPGPLTLVVEHCDLFPPIVTAHLPTVALRMPDHPVALALIKALGSGLDHGWQEQALDIAFHQDDRVGKEEVAMRQLQIAL